MEELIRLGAISEQMAEFLTVCVQARMNILVAGNTSFVARVDPRTRFTIGEKVQLTFNMENFHIFDPSQDKENPAAVR